MYVCMYVCKIGRNMSFLGRTPLMYRAYAHTRVVYVSIYVTKLLVTYHSLQERLVCIGAPCVYQSALCVSERLVCIGAPCVYRSALCVSERLVCMHVWCICTHHLCSVPTTANIFMNWSLLYFISVMCLVCMVYVHTPFSRCANHSEYLHELITVVVSVCDLRTLANAVRLALEGAWTYHHFKQYATDTPRIHLRIRMCVCVTCYA